MSKVSQIRSPVCGFWAEARSLTLEAVEVRLRGLMRSVMVWETVAGICRWGCGEGMVSKMVP